MASHGFMGWNFFCALSLVGFCNAFRNILPVIPGFQGAWLFFSDPLTIAGSTTPK
jgi:hypothetical protein